MRPQVAGEILQQLKQVHADREGATTGNTSDARPTSFFMAREEDLDKRDTSSDEGPGSESNYGVQSLDDTMGGILQQPVLEKDKQATKKQGSPKRSHVGQEALVSTASHFNVSEGTNQPPIHPLARRSPALISQPITPLSSVSPFPGSSLPSSPKSSSTKSFRPSDEDSMDETGSQAIAPSPEEQEQTLAALEGSMPQLIMPSLKMPSRRPFTERGRNIGRLKILLAGDTGVGKTSLIKSILQTCEDIVHVDPLSLTSPSLETLPPRRLKRRNETTPYNSTTTITEIYASTRPYPSWWSSFEENKVLRRRRSMGDTVLERNLCFVDTPGISTKENMDSILTYIDAQATKTLDFNRMDNGDLVSLVAGHGGSQVDVVFYLFSKEHTQRDLDFLLELRQGTNVIPILNMSDKLTDDQLDSVQQSIKTELEERRLRTFNFTPESPTDIKIYTTCSAPSHDDDDMDASLLVSPDYVQPLLPSELTLLIEQFFEKDNLSYLKHSAAKKLLAVRSLGPNTSQLGLTPRGSSLLKPNTPGLMPPLSSSSMMSSWSDIGTPLSPSSPYVQARILDHIQREEALAQIHLAKWAGELQRRLDLERQKFEGVAQNERREWLALKMEECDHDDLAELEDQSDETSGNMVALRSSRKKASSPETLIDKNDPLGLIRWQQKMCRRGWVALRIVSGLGVIGAVAVWAWNAWKTSQEQALWAQVNTNTRLFSHQQPSGAWHRGFLG